MIFQRPLFPILSVVLVCFSVLPLAFGQTSDRPNILLMMVDDLGYADFGCYGSEINTPNIDTLAQEGLRFTQFYNTAKCHSSRICLLTGLYTFQAGDQALNRSVTLAEVLGEAGYATSMTGKWHLDDEPTDHGFEQYFGHLSGSTDFFIGNDSFRFNGEKWNDFDPEFYLTDANVDYAMEFIDNSLATGKPFFHYIAYNAPHYPLQAPKEDIEKYLGKYDVGWETIRERRFAKQKRLGLFPNDMELPPLPEHMKPWDELTEKEREMESFRMAIYAAMVDRVDQSIGRMLDFLEERGVRENTLILLCSDNGACPFERSRMTQIPPWKPDSYYLYDASWATVGNTPFRHYKQTQHEGGISTPLIVNWPGNIHKPGAWETSPGHLIDVMATFTDITGATYPKKYRGEKIVPLQGKSLAPLFAGEARDEHDWLYFQFGNCRAIIQDDWKAVSFYGHKWELYNLLDDRVEQNDLADKLPEKVEALKQLWHYAAKEVDLAPAKVLKPVSDKPSPGDRNSWHGTKEYDHWQPPAF